MLYYLIKFNMIFLVSLSESNKLHNQLEIHEVKYILNVTRPNAAEA